MVLEVVVVVVVVVTVVVVVVVVDVVVGVLTGVAVVMVGPMYTKSCLSLLRPIPKPNPNASPTTTKILITPTAITSPFGAQGDQLVFRTLVA